MIFLNINKLFMRMVRFFEKVKGGGYLTLRFVSNSAIWQADECFGEKITIFKKENVK